VITGVSGSGKSTLAFDTIFAEGQRRYLEALSTRTRQFLQRLDAPKVDAVEGLSPAIAVGQATLSPNPRSTVGTLTEINDFLRLLYTHLGVFHCPTCGSPVRAYTIPQMVQEITDLWPTGSRLLILGPVGDIDEGELPKMLSKIRRDGFARVRLEDRVYDLDPPPHIPRRSHYPIEVVVDRLIVDPEKVKRLADALELASKIGRGLVGVSAVAGEQKRFSETLNCLSCGLQMPETAPSLFSFNHPLGACPFCKGLGYSDHGPDTFSAVTLCPHCKGARLNDVARSVHLKDLPIQEICRLPITALGRWFRDLPLIPAQRPIAEGTIAEILQRLKSLDELGLGYLTLERSANTLSGGEMQRLRLAHHISTPLSGVLYVLDEPSIGLHPRDHQRLLDILQQLRNQGNTLIIVEHDRETIRQADFVVDMGPGAGVHGGEVIFAGSPAALIHHPTSLTGLYLSGQKSIAIPKRRTVFSQG
jgi:excinuclease ABC subunit A